MQPDAVAGLEVGHGPHAALTSWVMDNCITDRERWIDADGLFVHTIEWDGSTGSRDRDRGDAPPLLLVHGLGGSTTNWLSVGPELAARFAPR